MFKKIDGLGVEIGRAYSDKYKKNLINLNFLLPLSDENISNCHVLASVLVRGCKKYPSVTEISRKVSMMYDVNLSVSAFKTANFLVFRLGVSFIDGKYLPDADLFSDVVDMIYEILGNAFPEDEKLLERYTDSEKKLRLDRIRADKDNKDRYALARCQQIMFAGTPLGCSGQGTEECVNAITSDILKETLDKILKTAPVYIVYAGNKHDGDEAALEALVKKLLAGRNESDIVYPVNKIPEYDFDYKDIVEEADANQGRAVLAYKIDLFEDVLCKMDLFNEVFGGSPVSRLFMNVRERLQLCYYCSSSTISKTQSMFVRSGVANENREKAVNEVQAQLEYLKAPDNIEDFEFDAAVRSLKNFFTALPDDVFRYADWRFFRHINGRSEDVNEYLSSLASLTKSDVSDVAKSAELKVNYFLSGK